MKLSYFDRYARSHRPLRTLTSVDTHANIGRSKTLRLRFSELDSQAPIIGNKNLSQHVNDNAARGYPK